MTVIVTSSRLFYLSFFQICLKYVCKIQSIMLVELVFLLSFESWLLGSNKCSVDTTEWRVTEITTSWSLKLTSRWHFCSYKGLKKWHLERCTLRKKTTNVKIWKCEIPLVMMSLSMCSYCSWEMPMGRLPTYSATCGPCGSSFCFT